MVKKSKHVQLELNFVSLMQPTTRLTGRSPTTLLQQQQPQRDAKQPALDSAASPTREYEDNRYHARW